MRFLSLSALKTESNIYAQLHAIGNGFAWSNKLETYDTNYYKWTQWIFIQLFKRGLAYRAKASVNWCPNCKTVLADEQVVSRRLGDQATGQLGKSSPNSPTAQQPNSPLFVCERCGTEVVKKELEQWFFRITNYAQRLLSGLDKIDWSEKVKTAQRNWLGKSEGLQLKFESDIENNTSVEVFTTRPDTLFGVTFMALAPEHSLVIKILDKSKGLLKRQIQKYVADSIKKPEAERIGFIEGEKQKDSELVKTGIKTIFHCTNPISKKSVPIFIADYVVMSYGTGAVMGVPAHDQRDYLFAKKYHIDIVEVIRPARDKAIGQLDNWASGNDQEKPNSLKTQQPKSPTGVSQEAFTGEGVVVNSGKFNGLNSQEAIGAISDFAHKKEFGTKKVMWHLRDWIISRQRYWGPPIPMIFCKSCHKAGKSWFTTDEAESLRQTRNSKLETRNKSKIQNSNDQNSFGFPARMAGWYPVPESDLPVELPYIENFKPTGKGVSPLAQDQTFVKVSCPACGFEARRETDVSDTFLDSSWYFLRYLATDIDWAPFPSKAFTPNPKSEARNSKQIQNLNVQSPKKFRNSPFDSKLAQGEHFDIRDFVRRACWLPVGMYIGGAEHSVLHLLYSRFLTMAFYDMNLIDFQEPFSKFRAHGLLIKEGAKMSKSKGNVVLPDSYIAKYGADTLRTYLMFCGRFDQGGDFRDTGIEGMSKFLKRIWKMVIGQLGDWAIGQVGKDKPNNLKTQQPKNPTAQGPNSLYLMHKTIKKVSEDIENLRYNTAISAIMEWVNALEERAVGSYEGVVGSQSKDKLQTINYELITEEEVKTLLLLLAPFAPYMTEELYQFLGNSKFKSIHLHPWPKYDPKLATSAKIELVVEVNGKVRDRIVVDRGIEKADAQKLALDLKNTQKYISGKKPKKAIFIKDRLINFVV
ncbi:MAG: Leucine-tRNA ligase [Candidatus Curtissbacteria bacterium GW2011_GWA1_41_11]|uniref:leucine--tRNA ligase n=1 Tax=Candidatus Curtissbacteria bacterium GW2011_GWA1_41_11 TaxID=1618409 RepID=A0A0G0UB60_9BACT|nr:MAG: Leucine-tRNA ligase [Candidatus Curtissbacteria bacterium GW2011_GWA1_41_11]